MSVDMSDFTEHDEGSIGYEMERVRREGYALADEVEAEEGAFIAAFIRDTFRRAYEANVKALGDARDNFLRQHGWIP